MIDTTPLEVSEWLSDAHENNRFRLGVAPKNYQYPTLTELHSDYSRFQARHAKIPLGPSLFRKELEATYQTSMVNSSGYRVKGIVHATTPIPSDTPSLVLPKDLKEAIDHIRYLVPSDRQSDMLDFLLEHYQVKTSDAPILQAIQALLNPIRIPKATDNDRQGILPLIHYPEGVTSD